MGLWLAASTPSFAAEEDKYSITPQEHTACDGDVVSLCSADFPDQDKVIGCMKAKQQQLSATCRTTFRAGMRRRHIPL